jgi:hypothetical protein
MPEFSFEIVRQGDVSTVAHVLRLSGERAIWRQVEVLALRIQYSDRTFIRVKNSEGEIVVRAGVATAIASIENCPRLACPLKKELRRRGLSSARLAGSNATRPKTSRRASAILPGPPP